MSYKNAVDISEKSAITLLELISAGVSVTVDQSRVDVSTNTNVKNVLEISEMTSITLEELLSARVLVTVDKQEVSNI